MKKSNIVLLSFLASIIVLVLAFTIYTGINFRHMMEEEKSLAYSSESSFHHSGSALTHGSLFSYIKGD